MHGLIYGLGIYGVASRNPRSGLIYRLGIYGVASRKSMEWLNHYPDG